MPDISYVIIGVFMICVFVVGVLENGVVVAAFVINKRLRTINNSFIVCLSVDNLLMTVLTFPQVISSAFENDWLSGHSGCIFNAFCATVTGLSQITLLALVAVDRYLIIVKQVTFFSKNVAAALASMVFCFLYALAWALGPLLGWSKYELETGGVSCSISWRMKDANNLSYTMCLFTFVWFIPLILITCSYSNILCLVNRKKPGTGMLVSSGSRAQRKSKEWKASITVLLMIGAFVVSWLPYSIISFWSVIGDVSSIPFGAILAPALIAKTSVIWNPVIYLSRHREFRRFCLTTFCYFSKAKHDNSSEVRHVHNQCKSDFQTLHDHIERGVCKRDDSCRCRQVVENDSLLRTGCTAEMGLTTEIDGSRTCLPLSNLDFINETCIE